MSARDVCVPLSVSAPRLLFHFPSWHSNLGASLREIQIHLEVRSVSRKAMSEEAWRDLRTIIFSTASDQISPPRVESPISSPSPPSP